MVAAIIKMIFAERRIERENGAIMGIYDRLYFQDILAKEWLKQHLEELEKIWN